MITVVRGWGGAPAVSQLVGTSGLSCGASVGLGILLYCTLTPCVPGVANICFSASRDIVSPLSGERNYIPNVF